MECKIDLAALMREEGLPLYVYADGTVTHKMVPGKIKIGKIWGCLDGVEPKEMLPCKEQFFSKPFTEEDARKQAEKEQQQLQGQETVPHLNQLRKQMTLLFLKYKSAGMRLRAGSFRRIQIATRIAKVWLAGLIRTRAHRKGSGD